MNRECSPAVSSATLLHDKNGHEWIPVSFRFETQLLDKHGRVRVRQPDMDNANVYVVCRLCYAHTYVTSKWVGYYLPGSHEQQEAGE